jgi:TonB family protein
MTNGHFKTIIFSSLAFLYMNISVLAQDTVYYKNWNTTISSKDSCEFYEVIESSSDSTILKSYYNFGELRSVEKCANYNTRFEKGEVILWYRSGNKKAIYDYDNAKLGHYGKSYISFWPNGNMKRKDSFNNPGESESGKCFGLNGTDTPYYKIEIMPQFPGGQDSLKLFIATNCIYPQETFKKKSKGTVYVIFYINEDGSVSDIYVKNREIEFLLQNEAIRVIQLMPKWKPGYQDGEPVKILITLPIKFG